MALIPTLEGAACESSTLPWTEEGRPAISDMRRMRRMCCDCPVLAQCGRLALQINASGTWAGIWIGARGLARADARRVLRARYGGGV